MLPHAMGQVGRNPREELSPVSRRRKRTTRRMTMNTRARGAQGPAGLLVSIRMAPRAGLEPAA